MVLALSVCEIVKYSTTSMQFAANSGLSRVHRHQSDDSMDPCYTENGDKSFAVLSTGAGRHPWYILVIDWSLLIKVSSSYSLVIT